MYKTIKKKFSKKYVFGQLHLAQRLKHHPFVVPVSVFFLLFFFSAITFVVINSKTVSPTDSHIVVVSYDNQKQSVPTRAVNVQDFLDRSNISINEGDVVEPELNTEIVEDNFRINIYRARPILIEDGDTKTFALSAATTPRSVASQAGVMVYPEDKVEQMLVEDSLKDNALTEKVVIQRSVPTYLNLYGTPLAIRTHAKTVGEVLGEKNVVLAPDDSVQPSLDTKITADTQIFVTRFGTQIIAKEEVVPNETQVIEDPNLSFGATAVRQKGSPGKKVVTYQLKLENGQEVGRSAIQEVIVVAPVARIVARGKAIYIPADKSQIMAAAGIAVSDYPYVNYIINHENGLWCPTRWQGQSHCPPYYEEKYPGAESNTSLGYGLCQSTPANKMATFGADWRTNVVTQLRWCSNYAHSRYGSWAAAYEAWTRRQREGGRGWW